MIYVTASIPHAIYQQEPGILLIYNMVVKMVQFVWQIDFLWFLPTPSLD